MIEKLKILYEQYKFDKLYINPNDIKNLEWNPDAVIDSVDPPNYLGTIRFNEKNIDVYWDKKITPGDVIFKYFNIKKERSIKLTSIIHNSSN